MTRIQVKKNVAYILDKDIFTRGQVGATVRFEFSDDWSNYVKVVVFVSGEIYKNVIITESGNINNVTVPWEVLTVAGTTLRIGVYGSNSLGTKLVPTIWCDMGTVRDSADPIKDVPNTPDFLSQMMSIAGEAKSYSESAAASTREIEEMTVSSQLVGENDPIRVSKEVTPSGVVNLNFEIPRGKTGTSITNIDVTESTEDAQNNDVVITMSDGTEYPFTIRNGSKGTSIVSVNKISSTITPEHSEPGSTDTYRVLLSDGSYNDIYVYNGRDGDNANVVTVNGVYPDPETGNIEITISNLEITATVEEINQLSGSNVTKTALIKLSEINATSSEINQLHGAVFNPDDLNKLHNVSATAEELSQLHESGINKSDLAKLGDITSTADEINSLHGTDVTSSDMLKLHQTTASAEELSQLSGSGIDRSDLIKLHDVESTAGELNQLHESSVSKSDLTKLHDITVTASELNQLSGAIIDANDLTKLHEVTASADELNKLDGTNVTTQEINYLHGVTSSIQYQLDQKAEITVTDHVLNINIVGSDDPDHRIVNVQYVKSVNPTDKIQYINPDPGYDAIGRVSINGLLDVDPNLVSENIRSGVSIFGVLGSYTGGDDPVDPEILTIQPYAICNPSTEIQTISADGPQYTSIAMIRLASATSIEPNLIPEVIRSGVSIFGVIGTYGTKSAEVATIQDTVLVNPKSYDQVIMPDENYTAFKTVVVNSVSDTDPNLVPENIKAGVAILGVVGTYTGSGSQFVPTGVTTQLNKTINPTGKDQIVYADEGYSSFRNVTINSVTNAEPNLIPENIKKGSTIFGITGTYVFGG